MMRSLTGAGRGVLLFLILLSPANAQDLPTSGALDLVKLRAQAAGTRAAGSAARDVTPMDAPLVATEYVVGPGDLLGIHVWSSDPREFSVPVTPEGYTVVPGYGRVRVADSTLAAAGEAIVALLAHYHPSSTITVSLLSPRSVIVEITGLVVNEGRYRVSSVERVDRLVQMANEPRDGQERSETFAAELAFARANASDRGIILRRRSGRMMRVDLVRHTLAGTGTDNPYLVEGDVIHVPQRSPLLKTLGAFGGVQRSGTFEHVEGDRLSFLLTMALGLRPDADSARALLTRLSPDATTMESLRVDLSRVVPGGAEDVFLRPGDRLVVPQRAELRQNYLVAVEGAVQFPGRYPITRGTTRLSDVVRAAGGFTPDAFLRGASVTRSAITVLESPAQLELEQLRSLRGGLATPDSGYFVAESNLRLKGELVAVDFEALFERGDTTQDVILRPYDVIRVPERLNTVYVFGQVRSPGHVSLAVGEGLSYYIARAGGYTEEARSGDVAVIKSGSRLWLAPDETAIEDGDFVWVPREIRYPFSHYVAVYAQIAAIVGTIATVALLIDNLSK